MLPATGAREATVIDALYLLAGESFPPGTDEEERALLSRFRALRRVGFGRMEVVVVGHHLDTLHYTQTLKRRDLGP